MAYFRRAWTVIITGLENNFGSYQSSKSYSFLNFVNLKGLVAFLNQSKGKGVKGGDEMENYYHIQRVNWSNFQD